MGMIVLACGAQGSDGQARPSHCSTDDDESQSKADKLGIFLILYKFFRFDSSLKSDFLSSKGTQINS